MKTVKLLSVAAGLASLCFATSCAEEQESLIIIGVVAAEDGCEFTVPAREYRPSGILDLSLGSAYRLNLEVSNQLVSQKAMMTNSSIDNSEMQISGVDVVLTSSHRPDVIETLADESEALVDFSPPVPTNSIGGGDLLEVSAIAIPAATATRLAEIRIGEARLAGEEASAEFMAANPGATPEQLAGVVANAQDVVLFQGETYTAAVTVRALRTGNAIANVGEIESREFRFPIEVCWGCLLSCHTCEESVDRDGDGTPETVVGICPPGYNVSIDTPSVSLPWSGLNTSCLGGQDDVFVPASCVQ